ncbi:MAG: transcriptional regulator, partial [Pseudomonadota bacterium]
VGSVFAFLSRYAVLFFATLHQGATLSLDKEQNIADVYYVPLLIMIAGFYLLFIALLLVGVRTEIRARRIRAMRLAEA